MDLTYRIYFENSSEFFVMISESMTKKKENSALCTTMNVKSVNLT